MSKIDTELKDLLLRKQKIDYIRYVIDLLKGDTKCIDFKEVQKDVLARVEPFLNELVASIEDNLATSKNETSQNNTFTEDETGILKVLAQKAKPKVEDVKSVNKTFSETPVSNQEKINFGLNNRHLANAKVVVNDPKNPLTGLVVGLDAPFVIIKTDAGPTIKVPVEKVRMP